MITNQKSYSLRLVSIFCILFIINPVIGQNMISDILLDGETVFQTDINIKNPNGTSISKLIQLDDSIDSIATIHVIDPKITVVIKTSNGTEVRIPGNNILSYEITKNEEKYKHIQGTDSSNIIIDKLKEFTGSVITTGKTSRLQARTRGTKFSLQLIDEDLDIKVDRGELEIAHLIKKDIKDDAVVNNDNRRAIFIRKVSPLYANDSSYLSSYRVNEKLLDSDKDIKVFLGKQFKIQKKTLINKGPLSKSAFKEFNKKDLDNNGILLFENALKNGEVDIELIVQSSFLFSDYYLYKDNREKSKGWLEAGLYFSKILYDENQNKLKLEEENLKLLKNNGLKLKEIDRIFTNALKYDMIIANEFTAWGYDIKLKLNGCLENANENPGIYRSNAFNLKDQIQKGN